MIGRIKRKITIVVVAMAVTAGLTAGVALATEEPAGAYVHPENNGGCVIWSFLLWSTC